MQKTDPFIERQIDLNVNIGEGFGCQNEVLEQELLGIATSANVSTGAHSGNPYQIDRSIKICKEFPNLTLGASISYPDIAGYGLRKMELTSNELRAAVISQLGALAALAKSNGFELEHVRPHGYLYNQLATNFAVGETVAKAVQEFSKWLILVGPSGNVLDEVSSWTNIRVSAEARVDVRYRENGTQIPFDPAKDLNLDLDTIAERARNLIYKGVSKSEDGEESKIKFESLHLWTHDKNCLEAAKMIKGMIANPMPLKSVDYEPYLSEFI